MSPEADIRVIGTEDFWDLYSSKSPSDKLYDVRDWCSNAWGDFIDSTSDGSYPDNFSVETNVDVPSAALSGCSLDGSCATVERRCRDADGWLQNKYQGYSNFDSMIVIDYYGNGSLYGWGFYDSAGTSDYKTNITDAYYGDNNELSYEYSSVGTEGIAYHELSHNFSSRHPDDVGRESNGDMTLMFSYDGADCYDQGSNDQMYRYQTYCSRFNVRDWYDNNIS